MRFQGQINFPEKFMKCPKCNSELPDKAKFCLECGSNISAVSGASTIENSLGNLRTLSTPTEKSLGQINTIISANKHSKHILKDRYELQEEIGRGGFAVVFRGYDLKVGNREVAVKVLNLSEKTDSQSIARFKAESGIIGSLNHRNIVIVFDSDIDCDTPFIAMEYINGGNLRDYLKGKGKLSLEEALKLFKGICSGIAYAHRKNLVHRDLKPGNVMLSREGDDITPKIVDFGLARSCGGSEVSVSGFGMGTPFYMPPEQRRDAKSVNHTADIYALGKILYEMLTGEIPDNVDQKLIPRPEKLSDIIFKCIKSKPEDRYFSIDEIVKDFDSISASHGKKKPKSLSEAQNTCPVCSVENEKNVRFCAACGAGLFRKCPECSAETSVQKKFCSSCGTDIDLFQQIELAFANINKYYKENKYSRVVKEIGLLQNDISLSGKKGKGFLKSISQINEICKTASGKITDLELRIEEAVSRNNYDSAITLLKMLLKLNPENQKYAEFEKVLAPRARIKNAERRKRFAIRMLLFMIIMCMSLAGLYFGHKYYMKHKFERLIGEAKIALCSSDYDKAYDLYVDAIKVPVFGDSAIAKKLRSDIDAVCGEREKYENEFRAGSETSKLTEDDFDKFLKKYSGDKYGVICKLTTEAKALEKERKPYEASEKWNLANKSLLDLFEAINKGMIPDGFVYSLGIVLDPNSWTREIEHKDTGIKMVYIPPGEFETNDPLNKNIILRIKISKGFYIGKYEVTQGQWEKVMGNNPSSFKSAGKSAPVESVTWIECIDFCNKLGPDFRLPSDAEWEYACSGINFAEFVQDNVADLSLKPSNLVQNKYPKVFPWEMDWQINKSDSKLPKFEELIPDEGRLDYLSSLDYLWCGANSGFAIHNIGLKQPNNWGLYDMRGNVAEFCGDHQTERGNGSWGGIFEGAMTLNLDDKSKKDKNPEIRTAIDPVLAFDGKRCVRGGAYDDSVENCTPRYRKIVSKDSRYKGIGLRLAFNPKLSDEKNSDQSTVKQIKPDTTDTQKAKIEILEIERPTSKNSPAGPVLGNDWKIQDIGMEFVWIKALDCWVGKYEVTNGEYRKFKPEHDSKSYKNNSLNGDRQPVVYVNYDDTTEYAKWLTNRESKAGRLPDGYIYRLPTEEEWTAFCQCGDNRKYPWGDTMPPKYGNYYGQELSNNQNKISGYNDGFQATSPVEKSGMNDWGLYGVGGNAYECTIKSGSDYSFDAWRGASWYSVYPECLHSTYRNSNNASNRDFDYGFRLVLIKP